MIVRAGTGWQYALADLSLILFLVTASALAQAGHRGNAGALMQQPAPHSAPPAPSPPLAPPPPVAAAMDSEPVAVWSAGEGAPALRQWLDQVGADTRLEVRVVVRYEGDGRDSALAQAVQLAASGGPRARRARLLVEPGDRSGASVSLFYAHEQPAPANLARPGLAR
ncbi:hypothetical protein [Novosphingobium sp. B1]|uniref:hypothetical protein n=1 Tax=Novosphingobium sp. B1 TaxID=1938756 RepID=UPI0009D8B23E|nr:hypothetical protein [Novosphingobium sp. B1]SMC58069.1 hypothetical protein SAMN06272759_104276 [Novosphingobium sp. B1]